MTGDRIKNNKRRNINIWKTSKWAFLLCMWLCHLVSTWRHLYFLLLLLSIPFDVYSEHIVSICVEKEESESFSSRVWSLVLGFYYWMSGVPHMWKDRSIPIKVGRSPPYRGLTAHSNWVDARDIRAHRDRQRHCHSKEEASVCIVIWSIGRQGEHILIEFFAWSRCWLKSLLFRQVEKCYVFHVFGAYVFSTSF